MRTDKDLAFELRKQGKSYNEICNQLGMSKSTLTSWFKGVDFSEEIKKSLSKQVYSESVRRLIKLNSIRGDLLNAQYLQAEKEALQDLEKYSRDPLFVAGVVAYWGEGDKTKGNQVRLINTDPKMLILFKNFLLKFGAINEEKLRGALFIYEDLHEQECKRFWTKNVGKIKFHKTQVLPSRHKSKKIKFGMMSLIVSSAYLKRKMLVWIDQLPKMVLNTVPKKDMRP